MAYIDFISPLHKQTKRNYLDRFNEYPKAESGTQIIKVITHLSFLN